MTDGRKPPHWLKTTHDQAKDQRRRRSPCLHISNGFTSAVNSGVDNNIFDADSPS
jgi:hypothetical protein